MKLDIVIEFQQLSIEYIFIIVLWFLWGDVDWKHLVNRSS
jgi:hypothetical protein